MNTLGRANGCAVSLAPLLRNAPADARACALIELVAAVEAWGHSESVHPHTDEETRLLNALLEVQSSGADVALLVPLFRPVVGA